MRRFVVVFAAMLGLSLVTAPAALAGSAHFINNAFSIDRVGNTLTVSGKEAGLGNLEQVHIVLSADAACVNPGSKKPQAANKQSVNAEGDFPVQNGKANFTLTVTATFTPNCSPPMTVEFSNVVVTDTTNGISKSFPGIF